MSKRNEKKAEVATRRAARLEQNMVDRPNCMYPQHTALTSFNKGCRCGACVEVRRGKARNWQKIAYAKDPSKFKTRVAASRARKEASDGSDS